MSDTEDEAASVEREAGRDFNRAELHEAVMRHVTYAVTQFNFRRDLEWKLHLGMWAAVLYWGSSYSLRGCNLLLVLGIALLIYLAYVLLWLHSAATANENDKLMLNHFRKEGENLLISSSLAIPFPPKKIPPWGHSEGDKNYPANKSAGDDSGISSVEEPTTKSLPLRKLFQDWAYRFLLGATFVIFGLALVLAYQNEPKTEKIHDGAQQHEGGHWRGEGGHGHHRGKH